MKVQKVVDIQEHFLSFNKSSIQAQKFGILIKKPSLGVRSPWVRIWETGVVILILL